MPLLLGVILGAALTIASAYWYDSSTGRAPNGLAPTAAAGQAPLVNWDVVNQDWQQFQAGVQNVGDTVEKSLKRHTG